MPARREGQGVLGHRLGVHALAARPHAVGVSRWTAARLRLDPGPRAAAPTPGAGAPSRSATSPSGSAWCPHTSAPASAGGTTVPPPSSTAPSSQRRVPAGLDGDRRSGRHRHAGRRAGIPTGAGSRRRSGSVAAGVAPAAGAAVVGVLGPQLAAAERAAGEGPERVAVDATRRPTRSPRRTGAPAPRTPPARACSGTDSPAPVEDAMLGADVRRPPPPPTTRPSRRGRRTRGRRSAAAGRRGPGRAAPQRVPAGVRRRVPVEHRQLDAERGPRRAGLRPHGLADLRRRAAVRPARPAAAVLDGRRAAGRRVRPPSPAHHGVGRCRGSCPWCWRWVARVDDPSRVGSSAIVFLIGMGQAVFGPTYSALLPGARRQGGPGRRHLAQLGADERLPGDRAGHRRPARRADRGQLRSSWSTPASYLLVIWSLYTVRLPPPVPEPARSAGPAPPGRRASRPPGATPWSRRSLVIVFVVLAAVAPVHRPAADPGRPQPRHRPPAAPSTACSTRASAPGHGRRALDRHGAVGPEHGQDRARRASSRSPASSRCSRCCGRRRPRTRWSCSSASPTSPIITSLSTVLQQRLDDSNRGRVMALWIMGFGGTVPLGNLIAGPLIEATSA